MRRLEERGVLRGYTVNVDPRAFGYQLQAIVRVRPLPGQLQEVERQIIAIPEFTECDKVTGEDCFIARLHVRSMEQLDTLLDHQCVGRDQHRNHQEEPGQTAVAADGASTTLTEGPASRKGND